MSHSTSRHPWSHLEDMNSTASWAYPPSRDGSTNSEDDLDILNNIPISQGPSMSYFGEPDVKDRSFEEVPIEHHPYWNSNNEANSISLGRIPPPQPPIMGPQTTGTTVEPTQAPPNYNAPAGAEVDWFKPNKNYRRPLVFVSALSIVLLLIVLGLGITLGVEEKKLDHLRQHPVTSITTVFTTTATVSTTSSTLTSTQNLTITDPTKTATSVVTDHVTTTVTSTVTAVCPDKKSEPLGQSPGGQVPNGGERGSNPTGALKTG